MPVLEHKGASIYYEEYGRGFPILTFAPGGLLSHIAAWSKPQSPINPATEWADEFRVIVMDQRNAPDGRSHAPITAADNWDTYAADHIALLDHLKIDQCHLYGQCIGGPFIMGLLKVAPERVVCAVAAQPNGRMGPLAPGRSARFNEWAAALKNHPELNENVLDAFYRNMYASGYIYSVGPDFMDTCNTPVMVMAGNDDAHPYALSEDMVRRLPNVEFIAEWKSGAALEAARPRVRAFLKKHTPAGG